MKKNEAQKAIDEMNAQREKYEKKQSFSFKIERIKDALFPLLFFGIMIFGVYAVFFYKNPHNQKPISYTKTEKKTAPSAWFNMDGEHIMFKDLAQAYLKYPHTYNHIQTLYSTDNEKEEMIVKTYFSGESSLRTLQKICLTAKYNFDGKLLTEPKECI